RLDQTNLDRLDEIVSQVGWPGVALVGEEAAAAARLLVAHAPPEKQREYLPVLRKFVSDGQASASSLATIEDDLALADTGEQIYGTEVTLKDGLAVLAPIENPEELDERRAAIGLPPIDVYLKVIENELGMTVDRSTLTSPRVN